jgi:hypothetical protein
VTDDGKISEECAFEDMAAIASQLGAVSLPWRADTFEEGAIDEHVGDDDDTRLGRGFAGL